MLLIPPVQTTGDTLTGLSVGLVIVIAIFCIGGGLWLLTHIRKPWTDIPLSIGMVVIGVVLIGLTWTSLFA